MPDGDSMEEKIYDAMRSAREEFYDKMREKGHDPSFFDIELEAFDLSVDDFLPQQDHKLEANWKSAVRYKGLHQKHYELQDKADGVEDLYG